MQNNFPAEDAVQPVERSAPQSQPYVQSPAMTAEELAQFEQFKKLKLLEQTRARISKVECDCLSPTTSRAQLKNLCREAERLNLGGIVVLPAYIKPCVAYLGGDPSCSLVAAISYPHGGDSTESKVAATKRAVKDGVDEVEVCAASAALIEGNMAYFKRECKKLVKAARQRALRLVLDCALLSEKDVVRACNCAADCGVRVIRLVNLDALTTLTSAKSAVRDRCLLKSDGKTIPEIEEAEALGVSLINCDNAIEICSRMLSDAKN